MIYIMTERNLNIRQTNEDIGSLQFEKMERLETLSEGNVALKIS